MKRFKAREGDFVETVDGLIFDVKGLIHPPDRLVAYLRYLEDPFGDRKRGERIFSKVYSLNEREKILESKFPHYLYYDSIFGEKLEGVPVDFVSKLYRPAERILDLLQSTNLDQVESQSVKLAKTLHDLSSVHFSNLGLSGSVLVNLQAENSDIDLMVYGRKNCRLVYETLKQLMQTKSSNFFPYNLKDLKKLYEFRSKDTQIPFEDFRKMEQRKFSQGKFENRDFFVRFILDWDEVTESYGDRLYRTMGYAKIKARIDDDTESIFTPCKYGVSEVRVLEGAKIPSIKEIASYRGRFCEQAVRDETVVAQGKVEKVIEKDGVEYFRLILGSKPSDFMISKSDK
jgi:predicted nucleotidyltransferase